MSTQAMWWLLELALKSGAMLAVIAVLSLAAKRLSAAEKHALWVCGLLGLLALPLASGVSPGVELPIRDAARALVAMSEPEAQTSDRASAVRASGTAGAASAAADGSAGDSPVSVSAAASAEQTADGKTAADGGGDTAVRLAGRKITAYAFGAYGLVAVLLLLRLGTGAARVAWTLRGLRPMENTRVLALLDDVRRHLGIRRSVTVRMSPYDATPWAWGARHPVVVVPARFAAWTEDAQRAAFVHELSHVARWDFVTTMLGYVCCALYWFQPLAWWALRRMTREAEAACDDRVLLAGGARDRYAAQLLEIARTIHGKRQRPMPAAAMATSSVSERISSILDTDARRTTMGKTKIIGALLLTAAVTVPVASLKSQEGPVRGETAEVNDPAFLALMQSGPSNDDELGLMVRTLVEHDRRTEAADVLTGYLLRDAAATTDYFGRMQAECGFCSEILRRASQGRDRELESVLFAAFDEVERRANETSDGNLLIRLADLSTDTESQFNWGLFYLIEGFRIGNLTDPAKLAAVQFLSDVGWYAQAKALAEQLHTEPQSSLYQSQQTERLMAFLDAKIDLSSNVAARLLGEQVEGTGQPEYMPLVKMPPVYPADAARAGLEGEVVVEFRINERGRTEDVAVVSSTNGVFDESAVRAASQFVYLPRLENGQPVEVPGVRNKITFVLDSDG